MNVLAQGLAAAEVTVIGICGRRRMMVVACAEVHVAQEFSFFAAYHECHFRVRLEADEAVDNVRACFLQAVRE